MGFLLDKCTVFPRAGEILMQSRPFSCGDEDLDDFIFHDAFKYERQLLAKSYCFCLDSDNSVIVCVFTLSNSSIDARNLPNNRKRKLTENIPHEKSLSSYPAALIGRLGVSKEFGGKGIGTELMDFIKSWMLDPSNKTACRYLTVDAYNNERTLKFYEANGFKTIFSSDKQEKEYIGLPPEKDLKTRFMYFDLMKT
jgi:GNAT superfamily N-acetyltransferase